MTKKRDQDVGTSPAAGEAAGQVVPFPAAGPGGDGPDPEAIRAMREAVEARARAEEEERGSGGGGGDEIGREFIEACLWANEFGDGELYKRLHSKTLLFNKSADCWLRWAGHHWEIDWADYALAAVEDVVAHYQAEAARVAAEIRVLTAESEKENERQLGRLKYLLENLNKRVTALRSSRRRKNCVHFAHTTEAPLAIRGDELDQKPWLLACSNGVIDLREGELRPGRQEDYLLKACPVEWQGLDAPRPRWEQFQREVFEENGQLIAFVQRLFGSALVGKVMEHVIVVLSGRGRNGKGTKVDILSRVLGPMAGPIRAEMLLDQGKNTSSAGPTPDIMALRGLRYAFASETDEHARISPSRVKWLTGADELSGRNPHDKYEVTFSPTHTLFLLTNHKPHAPADDYAFWERVLLIPFGLSYVRRKPSADFERQADPTLPDALMEEAPGILAWLVRGCLEWQRIGLDPPAIVKDAVAEYRRDEDMLGDFIDECLDIEPDDEVGTQATEVFAAFEAWWTKNVSKNAPKQRWFGKLLQRRFRREKTGGVYRYFGFRIRLSALEDLDQ